MTPEEAISLLKNPQVIEQMLELTRDAHVIKRLSEIAGGETVRQQLTHLLQNPDIAGAVAALVRHTETYQRMQGLVWAGAILVGIGAGLLAITLILAIYNTVLLRRLTREKDAES